METQMAEPSKTEPCMFLNMRYKQLPFQHTHGEWANSYFTFLLITLHLPHCTTLHKVTIINLRSCVLVKSAAEGR